MSVAGGGEGSGSYGEAGVDLELGSREPEAKLTQLLLGIGDAHDVVEVKFLF